VQAVLLRSIWLHSIRSVASAALQPLDP